MCITPSVSAQSKDSSLKNFLDSIKKTQGTNPDLINGYLYIPNYQFEGHPYFTENKWNRGIIYIDNNAFYDRQIKYNINKDALILKAEFEEGVFKMVQLNKLLVDSFRIHNRLFVNARSYLTKANNPVYYEQIFDGKISFLARYSKPVRWDANSPNGIYSITIEDRYIIDNGELISVNNRWSFLQAFPKNIRKQIRNYLKEKNIRYSSTNSMQLKNIMKFCSNLYD